MKPDAARVRRVGRRWQAEALIPDGGPWFVVSRHWTRWAARQALAGFLVLINRPEGTPVNRSLARKAILHANAAKMIRDGDIVSP